MNKRTSKKENKSNNFQLETTTVKGERNLL